MARNLQCPNCGNIRKGDAIWRCKSCNRKWCSRCKSGEKCPYCGANKGFFGGNIQKDGYIE